MYAVDKSFKWVQPMATLPEDHEPAKSTIIAGTPTAPAEGPPKMSQRDPRPNLVLFERLKNRTEMWSHEYLRFDWTCANI